MRKEIRTAVHDDDLKIEVFRFEGIVTPFPNHFHEYYVIGLMEDGERCLSCRNQEYIISRGQMVLFNPGDNHACVQNGGAMDYRGLNISREIMLNLAGDVTGRRKLPRFHRHVIRDDEAICYLRSLHEMVMTGSREFGKEENLLMLLSRLIQRYAQPFEEKVPVCGEEIEKACEFIENHYAGHICLEQICRRAGLSKSALLRAFAKAKGVTPYGYLENIRIGEAKKLLERGVAPAEAAMRTGFSDQSHFTNYFKRFIGLAPGLYRDIFLKKDERRGGRRYGA